MKSTARTWPQCLTVAALGAVWFVAGHAHAQTPPPGYEQSSTPTPPPPPPAPAAAPTYAPDDSSDVRYESANSDRVVLLGTGETHPAGTFFFTDYEISLLQFGYALTDHLQVSVTGIPPFFRDQPYFFDFGIKANVLRTPSLRAAIYGAFTVANFDIGISTRTSLGGRVGGAFQVCITQGTCGSSVTLNAGTFVSSVSADFLPIYLGLGGIFRVSDVVSLLAEPSFLAAIGDGSFALANGFLMNYGIRLGGRNWGVDLTLIRPFSGDLSDSALVLGIPWVTFTYRTDGMQNAAPSSAATRLVQPTAF